MITSQEINFSPGSENSLFIYRDSFMKKKLIYFRVISNFILFFTLPKTMAKLVLNVRLIIMKKMKKKILFCLVSNSFNFVEIK